MLLAELTGSAFHVAHMSARQSLRAVRKGKEAGIRVTCEVAPHHFTLTDESLGTPIPYDTNTKMNPPLREAADRDAMLEGLARRHDRRDRHRSRAAPPATRSTWSSTAPRSASSGSRRRYRCRSTVWCTPAW